MGGSESASTEVERGFCELLEGFVHRLRARRDAILIVLHRGDTAAALRLLHQLEGSSAMYGLDSVSRRAKEISSSVSRYDLRSAVALASSLCDVELVGSA